MITPSLAILLSFIQSIGQHDGGMKTADKVRAQAAIELADALIIDFNNPSSALKGINGATMEKLFVYLKISERAQRRSAKKLSKAAKDAVAEDSTSDASE